jgi:hypothetical protein
LVKDLDDLNELRASIQRKKEHLRDIAKAFQGPVETETDEFKRAVSKTLKRYAIIMEDLFNNVEMFAVLISGLKDHNELLKNIVTQLSEVKQNPQIQSDIQRAFDQFDEHYRRQLESVARRLDDSEKL